MNSSKINLNVNSVFWLSLAGVLAIIVAKAMIVTPQLHENFAILDNDSVMRLIAVRNWLGGQDWFDTVEYRLMPPEGVLMHWSRYIDAILGGMIALFSLFVSDAMAQTLAVVIWPTFLAICVVLVIGLGTRRLIGPEAACFAMLCAIVWPFTSDFYFLAGLIDHHNVQILMIVIVTFAIIWPDQPVRSGIVAGLAAAFALAIGLETLPYILLAGALMFVRANLGTTPSADRLLAVFCVTLGVAAVTLWLGQTPRARLPLPVCDQLGLPVISLIAIAAVASIVPMLLLRDKGVLRWGLGFGLIALGCLTAWPMLAPCLSGPYGSLPAEVQDIIRNGIVEAQPALLYASENMLNAIKMFVPVLGSLLLATFFWVRMPRDTDAQRQRRDLIGQLLILGLVGVLAAFSQVRLLLMTSAAVPVLVGFVLAILLRKYLTSRAPGDAAALLGLGTLLIMPAILEEPIRAAMPSGPPSTSMLDASCRENEALEPLNALARGVFLTPMNLGPVLMLTTHHSSLSGPYHRSPEAFANGYLPFKLAEPEFRAYVANTNATHIMLCGKTTYSVGFARDLVGGTTADWLEPVAIEAGDLMVFKVN